MSSLEDPNDNVNLILIKNNWYINKRDLLKKSKEEAIEFCMELEKLIFETQNKEKEKLNSWKESI